MVPNVRRSLRAGLRILDGECENERQRVAVPDPALRHTACGVPAVGAGQSSESLSDSTRRARPLGSIRSKRLGTSERRIQGERR